jgi:hypothetical protein
VARPSERSTAAGLPRSEDVPVKSSMSSTSYNTQPPYENRRRKVEHASPHRTRTHHRTREPAGEEERKRIITWKA